MPDSNIKILQKETYIKAIENAVGSRLFNTLFVQFNDSGEIKDILQDATFSCAYFVSSVLALHKLMDAPHTTVVTLKNLIASNPKWTETKKEDVKPGDIIFYEKIIFENGQENAHVGFILNNTEAVSTSYKEKMVVKHPIDNRGIDCIYTYNWE